MVDDGVATGATIKAALRAIRKRNPKELVLAIPVAPPALIDELRREVDALICLATPEPFLAVGAGYEDFRQVSDRRSVGLRASDPKAGTGFGKIPALEQRNRAAAPILSKHPPLYPANAGKFQ
ncbi:phosphoribosyltransferase family protein [Methylocella sp.]|uniref:phosphoribosyltransferase family protein n=1 Tax=Methylocella sp. TaxID=1978226 RepID=UPI003C1ACC62